jgi:Streptomycin adenylyltransferase
MSTGGVNLIKPEPPVVDMGALVTVILNSWRRPHCLLKQIEYIRAQSVPPAEIWIWADTCAENLDYKYNSLSVDRVFRNSTNLGVYGRFAIGLLARTRYVAVFDDDMLPGRCYLENCLATISCYRGIVAAAGVQFTSASYRPAERYGWAKRTQTITEVDIGCNAWFLERDWLHFLWIEPPFNWNNGEDMRLSYLAQKYGGIPTLTPRQNDDDLCGSLVKELGKDRVALSANAEHYQLRSQQLIEQLRHGWKTVRGVQLANSTLGRLGPETSATCASDDEAWRHRALSSTAPRPVAAECAGSEIYRAEQTIAQVHKIMEPDADVLGLLVVGSAVSCDLDAWSDVDFVMIPCDHALDKYYSDMAWLGTLGPVYTVKRSAKGYRRMIRACLDDLRRIDLIIVAQSNLIEYLGHPGPVHGGVRVLFSRSGHINEALAGLRPDKPLPHADLDSYRRMDETFWWNAVLTVVKVGRGDLLMAGHLALGLAQSCTALNIMLRDREAGTCHQAPGKTIARGDSWLGGTNRTAMGRNG